MILFSELSDYMLKLFQGWVGSSNVELHIYRLIVNQKEAPFEFDLNHKNIFFYDRESISSKVLKQSVGAIEPDMIICAGWMDRAYLKIISQYMGKIPTVMTMDNQWHGGLKQSIAIALGRFFLVPKFSHIWIPGIPQKEYAKKLGFKSSQIVTGLYVANSSNFSFGESDRPKIAKQFIFVGRYIESKGIRDLWQAFVQLQDEYPNEWELLCIGSGPLHKERIQHPKIKDMGFVQPQKLREYIKDGGVFVLPSHFEPWGVVVHEFALAGFPMIVSDAVGAASEFVQNGKNGYIFKSMNRVQLTEKMHMIVNHSERELEVFAKMSTIYAKKVTESSWIKNADYILGVSLRYE